MYLLIHVCLYTEKNSIDPVNSQPDETEDGIFSMEKILEKLLTYAAKTAKDTVSRIKGTHHGNHVFDAYLPPEEKP